MLTTDEPPSQVADRWSWSPISIVDPSHSHEMANLPTGDCGNQD